MTIHSDHPFVPAPHEREQARRFRGRLTAPVAIVTAGDDEGQAGLTVSSLLLVEGDPAQLLLAIGPTSDLWDVVARTRRLVIHVCRAGDAALADVFAGLRPSPGGVFSGLNQEMSEWGPIIVDIGDRAYCSVAGAEELGYSGIVTASVDRFELTELEDPLIYFRGRYRRLR